MARKPETVLDLFGRRCSGHGSPKQTTDIFSLDSDYSPGERWIIADWMSQGGLSEGGRRGEKIITEAERYAKCGLEVLPLDCSECRSGYFVPIFCRSRICERCGRIYKKGLDASLRPLLYEVAASPRRGYVLALLTLTVTSNRWGGGLPGGGDIKRFGREVSAFLRLKYGRFRGVWTKSGKIREDRRREIGAGSVGVYEVGSNNNNLHFHAIVFGPIRDWPGLLKAWMRITGDSRGVDVRRAGSVREVSNYVLKYITKPPKSDSYGFVADYAQMLKGTRRIRTGGIFYNRVKRPKSDRPACRCAVCGGRLLPGEVCLEDRVGARQNVWRALEAAGPGEANRMTLSRPIEKKSTRGGLPLLLPF